MLQRVLKKPFAILLLVIFRICPCSKVTAFINFLTLIMNSPSDFKICEQDISECLNKEPSAPILRLKDEKIKLPEPHWNKSKFVVNIQEKPDGPGAAITSLKQNKKSNEDEKKNESDRRSVSKEGLTALQLKDDGKKHQKNAEKVKKDQRRQVREPIYVNETPDYTIHVMLVPMNEDRHETPEQKSARLVFESRRKAFYLDEGITMKKGFHFVPEDINVLLEQDNKPSNPTAPNRRWPSTPKDITEDNPRVDFTEGKIQKKDTTKEIAAKDDVAKEGEHDGKKGEQDGKKGEHDGKKLEENKDEIKSTNKDGEPKEDAKPKNKEIEKKPEKEDNAKTKTKETEKKPEKKDDIKPKTKEIEKKTDKADGKSKHKDAEKKGDSKPKREEKKR